MAMEVDIEKVLAILGAKIVENTVLAERNQELQARIVALMSPVQKEPDGSTSNSPS